MAELYYHLDRISRPIFKYKLLNPTYILVHLAAHAATRYARPYLYPSEIANVEIIQRLFMGKPLQKGDVATPWHHLSGSFFHYINKFPIPRDLRIANHLLTIVLLPPMISFVLFGIPSSPPPGSNRTPIQYWVLRHVIFFVLPSVPSLVFSTNPWLIAQASLVTGDHMGLMGVLLVLALGIRGKHFLTAIAGSVVGLMGLDIALFTIFVIFYSMFGSKSILVTSIRLIMFIISTNGGIRARPPVTWVTRLSYLAYLPMLLVWNSFWSQHLVTIDISKLFDVGKVSAITVTFGPLWDVVTPLILRDGTLYVAALFFFTLLSFTVKPDSSQIVNMILLRLYIFGVMVRETRRLDDEANHHAGPGIPARGVNVVPPVEEEIAAAQDPDERDEEVVGDLIDVNRDGDVGRRARVDAPRVPAPLPNDVHEQPNANVDVDVDVDRGQGVEPEEEKMDLGRIELVWYLMGNLFLLIFALYNRVVPEP
ncbi:hypothetical protein IAR55_005515 [Kwoniella newhampshirensis]|uniref:Uncharacterized protein n=1 Tax=Kwoniella newhampshirensis TaxID=1651941 RepID=A0AAW0YIP5_9TREE